jgi:hypothetical protein
MEFTDVEATIALVTMGIAGLAFGAAIIWAVLKYAIAPSLTNPNPPRHSHFRENYGCVVCDAFLYRWLHGGPIFNSAARKAYKAEARALLVNHWETAHGPRDTDQAR